MKPTLTRALTQDELEKAPEKNAKKITGYARIQEPGKSGINHYFFDDGSELTEDDSGKKTKWPGEK